jgi:transcriptional regulator with XRE-family HTH domain
MTPSQSRAARGLLDPPWSQAQLAEAAGVSLVTVRRFETGKFGPVAVETVQSMQKALEKAGVIFGVDGKIISVARKDKSSK